MAKEDSNTGFLSKMAKFVRHPGTNWSDLDSPSVGHESDHNKGELKEILARKQRNDFVRKREFQMLRKVRNREMTLDAAREARPSLLQSSLLSKPDGRAMTLKKIDEIEVQMSMQWWKTKGQSPTISTDSQRGAESHGVGRVKDAAKSEATDAQQSSNTQAIQYKDIESLPWVTFEQADSIRSDDRGDVAQQKYHVGVQRSVGFVAPTAADCVVSAAEPTRAFTPPLCRTGLMVEAADNGRRGTSSFGFSASHFFALDAQEIAQNLEMEKAAIRFANGDDTGAEQGMLEVLRRGGEESHRVDDWLALFDLYRAIGQLAPFENLTLDFVNRFGRSAPQWVDVPSAALAKAEMAFCPLVGNAKAAWVCDKKLDAHAVGVLQTALLRARQPWVLDWSSLESMDLKAARALLGMFTLWGDQGVELCFLGATELRTLLKTLTPSGCKGVPQLWWDLRMAILRAMNQSDEFELTALDFCVTYEMSPPGWEAPLCHFRALSREASASGGSLLGEAFIERASSTFAGHSEYASDTAIDGLRVDLSHLGLVALSGELLGDPQEMLENLEQQLKGSDVLTISCRNLIRVSFLAAGTMLKWVSGHHAEGRLVQFVDVHRLVAAFFHVIGITKYAKVIVRND